MSIVQVSLPALEENSNRFWLGFPDEVGIDMTPSDVNETAQVANNFSKDVWSFPGNGEGADCP